MVAWFSRNYLPRPTRAISWADSPRLERLMRAGNIYLSLRDAIALVLENNLDIENARFNLPQADANLLRASAGQLLTNVSNSISSGPSSASGVLAGSGGFGAGATASSSGTQQGVLSGLNVQLAGSPIPNLDPAFYTQTQYSHQTTPLTSAFAAGTNALVTSQKGWVYGFQQSFLTGTTATLSMSNTYGYWQNAPNNDFNPTTSAVMSVSISQNLLKGFRPSVNNRVIRVAKNQLKISDLTFKQQIMATLDNVVGLYWDLVLFNDNLRIRQQALDLNTRLYEDNKRRAELGAIAPIDIIQAEAEMKGAQQDVKNAESQLLQQETILKGVLTRSGIDNLAIVTARIVPTDHFDVPAQERIEPIQDLISEAVAARPDVEQSAIGLEDTRISMLGTKDALLPTLSVSVGASNTGQAGQVNGIPMLETTTTGALVSVPHDPAKVNQFFLGGYGTALNQVFSRKFPSYNASIALTVPIRNRSAQADLIGQQLQYRQSEIQNRQLLNSVKINVINSYTALTQARAAWENAVEASRLQEETQKGTRRKYELGTATILDVVITQQTTVARELSEASALNAYVHAKLNLQDTLGKILDDYNVSIGDAKKGTVGREPDPIPAIPPKASTPPSAPAVMGILR
jgi:outer membrane protein TolC